MSNATSVTFEQGYRRLEDIADRLNQEKVPVHEMCELFAEGKGLEQALSKYLDEQKGRVDAIERGQGIQAFSIVAPAPGEAATGEDDDDDDAATADDADAAASGGRFSPQPASNVDDDIPF